LPDHICDEILASKHFVTDLPKIVKFVVINADEYYTFVAEKIPCKLKPWVNHRKPVRMKAAIRFGIDDHMVSSLVFLSRVLEVRGDRLREVVLVHEIVSGVIWRIDVDQFYLTEVCLLEQLHRIKIVTFDENVFRGVEVDAFLATGAKSFGNRSVGRKQCLALARPVEVIPLAGAFDN
jgi:hypothetical protein